MIHYFLKIKWWKLIRLSPVDLKIYQPQKELEWYMKENKDIHQKVEDNNIKNNIRNNNKVNRKIISNYTNQRKYSK